MKKISKANFSQLCKAISETHDLFIPTETSDSVHFTRWVPGAIVNLDVLKTAQSPKHFLLPQSETYLTFKTEGKKLTIDPVVPEQRPYVLYGLRACDAAAFSLVDEVFLREPVDQLYKEKRERGIVIGSACLKPETSCFCTAFDIQANAPGKGMDVFTWQVDDAILWEAQSEKGEALTQILSEYLEPATERDLTALDLVKESIKEQLKQLPLSTIDPKSIQSDLKTIFEAPIWEKMSKSCLSCGACTYVCPTCHCYDIQDYDGQKKVERYRCWDSCMFSDFTMMAHGNPRTGKKERFRQRFMHKLVYFPNNHDAYACVGCGRCVDKCPVNMNIAKVINRLGGENI